MNLEGTKTQANLMAAFAGESEARNKYTYYASKAKKDGFVQISQLFTETANNEKEHAKIWFKLLHNGSVPDTATNLQDAATGENYEWTEMYPQFAREAREEGFEEIARLFEAVPRHSRFPSAVLSSRVTLTSAQKLSRSMRQKFALGKSHTSRLIVRFVKEKPTIRRSIPLRRLRLR